MFPTEQIPPYANNGGTVTIGLKLGKRRFDHWVDEFGFGKPTGVDLPGEERGQVLPLSKYSGSSMGNLPIGQGISVTPMQMAAEYAPIASGGIRRAPRVVGDVGGVRTSTPPGRRIMSAGTA